jgi:hypothetical protein
MTMLQCADSQPNEANKKVQHIRAPVPHQTTQQTNNQRNKQKVYKATLD